MFSHLRKHVPEHSKMSFDAVAQDERFLTSPGSSVKHHNWTGGLAQHTLEVANLCLKIAEEKNGEKFNLGILVVSAMWHDYGKIWAYELGDLDDQWVDTKAKHRTGGHLARSYAEYVHFCYSVNNKKELTEFQSDVGHCILSHHGCREWGSVARPQTNEAFILHMADQISARCMGGESWDK